MRWPDDERSGFDRPRLAIIVAANRRRGAEVQGERIAEGLHARGWDVDLIALGIADPGTPTIAAEVLTSRTSAQLGRLDVETVRALRSRFRHSDYDLVLANGSITLRYVAAASPWLLPRSARGYVSIGEPQYWIRNGAQLLRQRALMRRVGWVLAVSTVTARQVRRIAGSDVDVTVVHGGVTPDFLEVAPSTRSASLNVLFVGSLSDEKDPASTLAAVGVALAAGADVNLRFVGAGPLADDLSSRAARDGLSSRVAFTGAKTSVVSEYAWADVLLVTSRTEGLPGVVLEAGAAGVPTLAFDVGGVGDVVRDEVTGRLVPAGDIQGLAGAIAAVAADEEERLRLANNIRALVAAEFLIDSAVDRYDSALRRHLRVDRLRDSDQVT